MKKLFLFWLLFSLIIPSTSAYKVNDFLYFPWWNYYFDFNSKLKKLSFGVSDNYKMNLYNIFYWSQFRNRDDVPSDEEKLNAEYRKKLFQAVFDVLYTEHKLQKAETEKSDSYDIEEYRKNLASNRKELTLAKIRYDNSSLAEKDYNEINLNLTPILELYFNEMERIPWWLQLKEEKFNKSMCSYFPKTWRINFDTVNLKNDWIKEYYLLWVNNSNSFGSPTWKNYAPAFIIQNKNDLEKIDNNKFYLEKMDNLNFISKKVEKFKCNWNIYNLEEYNWKSCYDEKLNRTWVFTDLENELNFSLDLKNINNDFNTFKVKPIWNKSLNLNFVTTNR